MSTDAQQPHRFVPPMQLRRHAKITRPNVYEARVGADVLRERAELHAVEAAKRRETARKQGRNGTPSHVTDARLRAADDEDDTAALLFALADYLERAAHTEG